MQEPEDQRIRFSPPVDQNLQTRTQEEAAAEALLGLDLGPGGVWSRPIEAAEFWRWLRDERMAGIRDLGQLLQWTSHFLGFHKRPSEPARWLALGFAQGVECSARGTDPSPAIRELLPSFEDNVVTNALEHVPHSVYHHPLASIQNWADGWLTRRAQEKDATHSWATGVLTGHVAFSQGYFVCGQLAAQIESARADQRFVASLLARYLEKAAGDPWISFVHSTYAPETPEARAIAYSTARSLQRANSEKWTLRQYMLDAAREGEALGRSDPVLAEAVSLVPGEAQRAAIATCYGSTTGPVTQSATANALLAGLKLWLRQCHPGLFGASDPGAEMMLVRNAYDFLWWRGLLHGLFLAGRWLDPTTPSSNS